MCLPEQSPVSMTITVHSASGKDVPEDEHRQQIQPTECCPWAVRVSDGDGNGSEWGRSVKIKGYRVELYAAPTWGPPLVIMRSEPGAIRFSLSVYFWPFVFAVNGPIRRSPGVDLEYIDHQSPDYWG